ncbi:MAG: tetratricopeptide repeat protein [Flavisolibacter sp.]|jgi:Ca-activated chloride channel family protein
MKTMLVVTAIFLYTSVTAQEAILAKGNEYYRQEQYELAEAQYRKVLETSPDHQIALYNLANALQKQKKYDEAAVLLEQLVGKTKDPKVKEAAYYNQGVANTKLKNLEASIESYKNALRINPTDNDARENLQKALLELKSKQQQNNSSQKKSDPKMSQKEAEQKLKLLQQKEKELQQRKQDKNKQQGPGQQQDW